VPTTKRCPPFSRAAIFLQKLRVPAASPQYQTALKLVTPLTPERLVLFSFSFFFERT